MLHDQEAQGPGAPLVGGSVHWYAVLGAVVGAVVFLVATAAAAYRCYNKYNRGRTAESRLSEAIKRGLTEPGSHHGAGLRHSPSPPLKASTPLRSPSEGRPMLGGGQLQQPGAGDVEGRHGPGGYGGVSCKQAPLEVHLESEGNSTTRGQKGKATSPQGVERIISPTEKDEGLKEKHEDDLKIQKLGTVHFNVEYDKVKMALVVTIIRACELPPRDPSLGTSDPYVKLQLLPEKRHKVKTRVLRKTTNPVYDETFTFYGLDFNQLAAITLHFVILSFDRFSRDDIIGEVLYPLAGLDLEEKEVCLSKEISPRTIKMHSAGGRGELLVSLCYQPGLNRLTVVVLKARNLPKMDITGLSDPYVKIYLLYNGQRIAKKKTHVKKRTLNPVFNESFGFDVPCNEGLQNISLEFVMLDWDRVTKNDIIGKLHISASPPSTEEATSAETRHWNEVMNCPRKQIAEWHKLTE